MVSQIVRLDSPPWSFSYSSLRYHLFVLLNPPFLYHFPIVLNQEAPTWHLSEYLYSHILFLSAFLRSYQSFLNYSVFGLPLLRSLRGHSKIKSAALSTIRKLLATYQSLLRRHHWRLFFPCVAASSHAAHLVSSRFLYLPDVAKSTRQMKYCRWVLSGAHRSLCLSKEAEFAPCLAGRTRWF